MSKGQMRVVARRSPWARVAILVPYPRPGPIGPVTSIIDQFLCPSARPGHFPGQFPLMRERLRFPRVHAPRADHRVVAEAIVLIGAKDRHLGDGVRVRAVAQGRPFDGTTRPRVELMPATTIPRREISPRRSYNLRGRRRQPRRRWPRSRVSSRGDGRRRGASPRARAIRPAHKLSGRAA